LSLSINIIITREVYGQARQTLNIKRCLKDGNGAALLHSFILYVGIVIKSFK